MAYPDSLKRLQEINSIEPQMDSDALGMIYDVWNWSPYRRGIKLFNRIFTLRPIAHDVVNVRVFEFISNELVHEELQMIGDYNTKEFGWQLKALAAAGIKNELLNVYFMKKRFGGA